MRIIEDHPLYQTGIPLYVRVSIEVVEGKHRQAKLIRLPGPIAVEPHVREGVGYTANKWGETFNGWTPAVNHRSITTVNLYWLPIYPDVKIRKRIHRYLPKYVKRLMAIDESFHSAVLSLLNGTGWYFLGDILK